MGGEKYSASLHCWRVNLESARKIQSELVSRLVLSGEIIPSLVAGADCAYSEKKDIIYAVVVVYDLNQDRIIEIAHAQTKINFPYIPGYLSFREGPVLLKAFRKLHTIPEAIIFDGQGIAHPRKMGIASHLGLWLEIPSLGCAKTNLWGNYRMPARTQESREFIYNGEEIIGAVVRTQQGIKPVFVSPGHLLGLECAIQIVLKSVRRYRIPEPQRLAHLWANWFKKEGEKCERK